MLAGEPLLNNSAANKNAALLTPWQAQGLSWHCVTSIQRATCLLTFAGSTPSETNVPFFFLFFSSGSRINDSLMLRPTLSFYIWDVLWPPRCLSVPLASFPAPLHSTLLSPPPLFILTPSTRLCETVEHQRRVTKTIRHSGPGSLCVTWRRFRELCLSRLQEATFIEHF